LKKSNFVLEKYRKPQSDFCTKPVGTNYFTRGVWSGDRVYHS